MTALVLAAAIVTVAPPPPQYADTESSLNFALNIEVSRLRNFRLALDFYASSTSNYEFSLGSDADGNGVLDMTEADMRIGYDCGVWKEWHKSSDEEIISADQSSGTVRREYVFNYRDFNPQWNMLRIVRRGSNYGRFLVTMEREDKSKFTIHIR